MICYFITAATEVISPCSPTLEAGSPKEMITTPVLASSVPVDAGMSSKGKAPVQDFGISTEELQAFSLQHDNLVSTVSESGYTRRLTALMNARKDRKMLEAIGNHLMLSTGLVFQQLEGVELLEKELKLAQKISEKLRKENEQAFLALGTEKEKVALLKKEKCDAVEEKKKVEEEKCKSDQELQFAFQRAEKA